MTSSNLNQLILIIFVAGSLGFGWYWGDMQLKNGTLAGYETGTNEGYSLGFSEGYNEGNSTGFQSGKLHGHTIGFSNGYSEGETAGIVSGYKEGYEIGHINGTNEGLQTGYESGFISGYDDGNEDGYSEGRSTGYSDGYSSGYDEGNETGFEYGYAKGLDEGAGSGYTIRDPSYIELVKFLRDDKTERETYHYDDFNCYDFSATVARNAFDAGYQCYTVYIELAESAHMIVAFNTTDKGMQYYEPQDDNQMYPRIGQPYWNRRLYTVDYNDTIIDIDLVP